MYEANTVKLKRRGWGIPFWIALTALFFAWGCGQKQCQVLTTVQKTFVDLEWRLVSTNDPGFYNAINNTNFLTAKWGNTYKGEVFKVENNQKYNTPVLTFAYNVDPTKKVIKMQYYTTPEGGGDPVPSGDAKTYSYELGKDFVITDQTSGYNYRYIPFQAIVRPDDTCTF
jgi:hypothetical protein